MREGNGFDWGDLQSYINIDIDKYINSGVSFFTKNHRYVFDNLINIYEKNVSDHPLKDTNLINIYKNNLRRNTLLQSC